MENRICGMSSLMGERNVQFWLQNICKIYMYMGNNIQMNLIELFWNFYKRIGTSSDLWKQYSDVSYCLKSINI
jgi:hypothetical protein